MIDPSFITLTPFDLIALGAVIFIGLPHGAFDGALYALLPDGRKPRSMLSFLTLYIITALAIIALWHILPLTSLAVFLALSAFHFGKNDSDIYHGKARLIALISHGGLAAIYLPYIHYDAAYQLFAALTWRTPDELGFFSIGHMIATVLWALSLLIYGWMAILNAHYRARFIETLFVAALMAWLPILAAFAFYFCAIHSRRHFIALYHATKDSAPQTLLPLGAGLCLASWMAGGIALLLAMQYQSFALSAIQIIFIGLAALTVPHMILVDGLWRPLSAKK